MKTTMLWCSAHQPTQEQINELEERRLILLKALSKDDGGISTVQTDRRLKNSSDFGDVLETSMLVLLYNWEEQARSYSWQDHSSRGDE
jgi:hypothetical protein